MFSYTITARPSSTLDSRFSLLHFSRECCHLQFADGPGNLDIARTRHSAIEDGVATRHAARLADDLQALGSRLVAAVENKAMCCDQCGRSEIIVARPEGWAGGGAGRA